MSKLIPSRVLKKVFEMVTLIAELMVDGKVSEDRAGRAVQAMVFTEVKSLIVRVERSVRLFNMRAPPIEPIDVLPKLVRPPAFSQVKSPVIC